VSIIAASQEAEPNLEELVTLWREAKRVEAQAEAQRVSIGNKLANILGVPDEGSKSYDVGDFKVTVKQPINRKVDWEVFDAVAAVAPEGTHMPAKVKRELDETGLKWIREHQPELYAELAKAITASPGRIGIEIKERA
jgi:hypothetical protein